MRIKSINSLTGVCQCSSAHLSALSKRSCNGPPVQTDDHKRCSSPTCRLSKNTWKNLSISERSDLPRETRPQSLLLQRQLSQWRTLPLCCTECQSWPRWAGHLEQQRRPC